MKEGVIAEPASDLKLPLVSESAVDLGKKRHKKTIEK